MVQSQTEKTCNIITFSFQVVHIDLDAPDMAAVSHVVVVIPPTDGKVSYDSSVVFSSTGLRPAG